MKSDEDRIDERPSGLTIINPASMFDSAPLGFSQLAVAPAGARTVYVAGQTGGADKGTFAEQCTVAFQSIDTAMRAAGGSIRDVARLTVYIVDHDQKKHDALITAVENAFDDRMAPTCTIVPLGQSGLSRDQLVEIEAVGILAPDAD